jgi:hypothetical protein
VSQELQVEIARRLATVRERISEAARLAGRDPNSVTLLGVSKRKSAEEVVAALRAGLCDFGENYLQEAAAKIAEVRDALSTDDPAPRWHFIGQLQRNKARDVAQLFDSVSCVDRARLGNELQRRAEAVERDLEILLQVNTSAEPQKGGAAPEALAELLAASSQWSRLQVRGLMTIPAAGEDPEARRPAFARLRELRDTLRTQPGGEHLTELSMGMSGDFEVAIQEGATIVRVGTAIFGPRRPQ